MTEKPRLKKDWVGRRVSLLRRVVTKGGVIFEPGTVMVVERNFGGLTLEREILCEACASRWKGGVVGVPERDVEILPGMEDLAPFVVDECQGDDKRRCPFCGAPEDRNRNTYPRYVFQCGSTVHDKHQEFASRGDVCRVIAELRRRNEHLTACMKTAGLQAFLRERDPAEVAEHLRSVAASWGELEEFVAWVARWREHCRERDEANGKEPREFSDDPEWGVLEMSAALILSRPEAERRSMIHKE